MRLRLVENAGKLGAVLCDGTSLMDALSIGKKLQDGLNVAIQPTDEPETFTPAHLLIRCQRWLPAEMRLDTATRELAVECGTTTVGDLQGTCAQWVNAVNDADTEACPAPSINVLKPFGFQMKDPEAIALLWGTKGQPATDSLVTSGVLNCKAGDLLLYKDSREAEQLEPPPVSDGSASKPAREDAPGFKILSPTEQLAREQAAAEKRQPQGRMAVDLEERLTVLQAHGVGAGGTGGIQRMNSL